MFTKTRPQIERAVPSNDSGFTLLEVMIAVMVFAFGILATVSMQMTAVDANGEARRTTEASNFAADRIESLRPLNYQEDADLTDGSHVLADEGDFAISYTVQRNTIIDNTMLIQMTVQWTDRGVTRSVVLSSLKSDTI